MKKYLLLIVLFLIFLPGTVNAQLLVVTKDGVVEPMVLAETNTIGLEIPQNEIDIKKIADSRFSKDSSVFLSRADGVVVVTIESEKGKQDLELVDWKDNIIEVEERPQTQKVTIGLHDEMFGLENKGIIALTDYSLKVDAKSARILAKTDSGEKYVAIMPFSAVETLVRSKAITGFPIDFDNKIYLKEVDNDLVYSVVGEKGINFFNLYYYPVAVEGLVSALNGEVVEVKQPKWLRILGFMFE